MKFSCLSVLSILLFVSFIPSISAFAAKKKGVGNKKRATTAASNRGFGKAPPTYEETLASFKTRLTSDTLSLPCPCGSGGLYSECCAPFHSGTDYPPTPRQVLQSRYTAFLFRNVGYIIETTHPVCRDYQLDRIAWAKSLDKDGMFDSYEFVSLNILDEQQDSEEDEATIDFQVKLRSRETGQETTVQEKSKFLKLNDKWLYASGQVRSTVEGVDDIVLNQ